MVIPWNEDAEIATLGSMMLSPNAAHQIADVLDAADFYAEAHQVIFAAIVACVHEGRAVDPVTVTSELQRSGTLERAKGRANVLWIQAQTPASMNAAHYAEEVARMAACRRTLAFLETVRVSAASMDLDAVQELLDRSDDHIQAPLGTVRPGDDLEDMLHEEALPAPPRWIIPDCLAHAERMILTGIEGLGKSTLIRQMAVQCACGVHPFDLTLMDRQRVLHLDMENTRDQSLREYNRIATDAVRRKYERGWLAVKWREQGLDLTRRADVRWLESLIAHHEPSLLVVGPLYKMMRGTERRSIHSEEAAAEVAFALDELRVRYDLGVVIEAHSPHGDAKTKARDPRPIGASLWLRWPEFGHGLKPIEGNDNEVRVSRWRMDRVRGRRWPTTLRQGGASWPWTAPESM